MKFGMRIKLNYWDEEQNSLKLPDLIVNIAQFTDEVQYYAEFLRDGTHVTNIVVKSYWPEKLESIAHLIRSSHRQRIRSLEQFEACSEDGCFEKVIASQYPALKGFYLHDRHGEDYHAVHQYCPQHHIKPSHEQMLKTLAVVTTSEGKYWEKIVSWQLRSYFIDQKIELDWESTGDYGEHYDYQIATPFVGPFKSREEAIEAARKYTGHD